jgi:hypothetical protein
LVEETAQRFLPSARAGLLGDAVHEAECLALKSMKSAFGVGITEVMALPVPEFSR